VSDQSLALKFLQRDRHARPPHAQHDRKELVAMTNAGATTTQVNATKDSLKNAPAWTWNTDKNSGGTSRQPVAK
jgi:hypothetical protein